DIGSQSSQGSETAAGWFKEPGRKGIADRVDGSQPTVHRGDHRGHLRESGPLIEAAIGGDEHDAVGAANYDFRTGLIGESEARSKIVEVPIDVSAIYSVDAGGRQVHPSARGWRLSTESPS